MGALQVNPTYVLHSPAERKTSPPLAGEVTVVGDNGAVQMWVRGCDNITVNGINKRGRNNYSDLVVLSFCIIFVIGFLRLFELSSG